jgi:hypothetical protein
MPPQFDRFGTRMEELSVRSIWRYSYATWRDAIGTNEFIANSRANR